MAEKIVTLADDYARRIVDSLPQVPPEMLTEGISGALLSFLAAAAGVLDE